MSSTRSMWRRPKTRARTETSRPDSWRKKCSTSRAAGSRAGGLPVSAGCASIREECGSGEFMASHLWPGSQALRRAESRHLTNLHAPSLGHVRAALGVRDGVFKARGLDHGVAADKLLGFDEGPVGNDVASWRRLVPRAGGRHRGRPSSPRRTPGQSTWTSGPSTAASARETPCSCQTAGCGRRKESSARR